MAYLVVFEFPFDGPFGDEAYQAFAPLAADIGSQPGLIWKIWTENAAERKAGGVYLFSDERSAVEYISFHSERLQSLGVEGIRSGLFDVNTPLSEVTHAGLSRTAN